MAEGNGRSLVWLKWSLGIVAVLLTAFILGGVRIANSQGKLETRMGVAESDIEEVKPAVAAIAVVQNDISHIKSDMGELKDTMSKVLMELRKE